MMSSAEIIADVQRNWWLYASMPLVAAAIGYVTKIVAIRMMFEPIEFFGKPPYFGWQGIVPRKAAFMADSQVPWGVTALGGTISEPAWRTKPSWYLLTTDDKMIPAAAQRLMSKRDGATVVEVTGSHAIYVSQPQAVAISAMRSWRFRS